VGPLGHSAFVMMSAVVTMPGEGADTDTQRFEGCSAITCSSASEQVQNMEELPRPVATRESYTNIDSELCMRYSLGSKLAHAIATGALGEDGVPSSIVSVICEKYHIGSAEMAVPSGSTDLGSALLFGSADVGGSALIGASGSEAGCCADGADTTVGSACGLEGSASHTPTPQPTIDNEYDLPALGEGSISELLAASLAKLPMREDLLPGASAVPTATGCDDFAGRDVPLTLPVATQGSMVAEASLSSLECEEEDTLLPRARALLGAFGESSVTDHDVGVGSQMAHGHMGAEAVAVLERASDAEVWMKLRKQLHGLSDSPSSEQAKQPDHSPRPKSMSELAKAATVGELTEATDNDVWACLRQQMSSMSDAVAGISSRLTTDEEREFKVENDHQTQLLQERAAICLVQNDHSRLEEELNNRVQGGQESPTAGALRSLTSQLQALQGHMDILAPSREEEQEQEVHGSPRDTIERETRSSSVLAAEAYDRYEISTETPLWQQDIGCLLSRKVVDQSEMPAGVSQSVSVLSPRSFVVAPQQPAEEPLGSATFSSCMGTPPAPSVLRGAQPQLSSTTTSITGTPVRTRRLSMPAASAVTASSPVRSISPVRTTLAPPTHWGMFGGTPVMGATGSTSAVLPSVATPGGSTIITGIATPTHTSTISAARAAARSQSPVRNRTLMMSGSPSTMQHSPQFSQQEHWCSPEHP